MVMASYRIICTNQVPVTHPKTDAHVVAVGTGPTPQSYTNKWTLDQVLNAMRLGDTFYSRASPPAHSRVLRLTPARSAGAFTYDPRRTDCGTTTWTHCRPAP